MVKTALITGASSGIGKEFCKIFAQNGHDLVISSRFQNQLDEMQQELEQAYKVKVTPVAADLGSINAAQELYNKIKGKGIEVEFLVTMPESAKKVSFMKPTGKKNFTCFS